MGIFRKTKISNKGLKYKLLLAFSLMSIIPLLACTYIISNNVFPNLDNILGTSAIVLASIIIAVLGLILARGLVDPVIDMAVEAKMIASGNYEKRLAVESDDEVGNLAGSINAMTMKIRTNLDELKGYGQKMKEINVDIHKKVLALSSLLQIGDIISAGAIQLDSLLDLAVERISTVIDGGYALLYTPRADGGDMVLKTSYGTSNDRLLKLVIRQSGSGVLERSLSSHSIVTADKTSRQPKDVEDALSSVGVKNILVMPIYSGRNNLGMLITGSKLDEFKFKNDDVELVKVFAKQITIAIESDILNKKTEALAIKDDLTGLYNKNFILDRLEEEIKRAIFYQRPCSFIVFNIDDFRAFRGQQGELAGEEAVKKIAKLVKDNMDPICKAARIGGNEFAVLLPEKNKKEAAGIAEEIRSKIAMTSLSREKQIMMTVSCGVSENPIDGATSDELYKKAVDSMKQAKTQGKNRIVA